MTTISATIVADSASIHGARITTFQLRYPRWIHGEFMTHRAFARNASSSRAIPVKKMIAGIEADPAFPVHLGKHQSGMQADEQISDPTARSAARALWRQALRASVLAAKDLVDVCGVAKQVANRLTEPFQHMDVIVTATDWDNFFALRCHPAAEPTIRVLAWSIADAYFGPDAKPLAVAPGGWHLPYIQDGERLTLPIDVLIKCSAARCARVSYKTHDGAFPKVAEDLALYDRLLAGLSLGDGEPGHMSPLEHPCTPLEDAVSRSGPFRGWKQHRKDIPGECMTFDYHAAIARGWKKKALEGISVVVDALV